MPLISDIPDTQSYFLSKRRLVIDSSSLIRMVHESEFQKVMLYLMTGIYRLYFPAWLMLEIGFGPIDKQHESERTLVDLFYTRATTFDDMCVREMRNETEPQFNFYIPNQHEYYQARRILERILSHPERTHKQVGVNLRADALIFACPRNLFAGLITDNKKDFHMILENSEEFPRRILPIFNLDELRRSMTEKVVFSYKVSGHAGKLET